MKKFLIIALLITLSGTLFAQNYQISFTSSGMSSTIDSIQVTNLIQGTSVTLMGSDVLYLVGTVGLSEKIPNDKQMRVYPNPMSESSTIEFYNPDRGLTTILITDNAGKTVLEHSSILGIGVQAFSIQGLLSGCYLVNIRNSKFICNTNLISVGNERSSPCLKYKGNVSDYVSENIFKSSENLIQMQYNDGERLLFKGLSSNYARILTLVPSESQVVDFEFIECTDFDNNFYPVVTIGDQTWMAENLKVTHYQTGDEIPNIIDGPLWSGLSTGAYCWYSNDISWKDAYGALYNWYAVVDSRELCPAGWHTPSNDEWAILTNYLGGEGEVGGKMKSTRTEPNAHPRWNSPNESATNESGFSALPGGSRNNYNGSFSGVGQSSRFWSSSNPSPEDVVCYFLLDGNNGWTWGCAGDYYKPQGISVRCIKD